MYIYLIIILDESQKSTVHEEIFKTQQETKSTNDQFVDNVTKNDDKQSVHIRKFHKRNVISAITK